jgi:predicted AAA+ superfamily ATPase
MLKRTIEGTIDQYLKGEDRKILFVWGPRRSGKTTLLDKLAENLKVTKFNFDLQSDKEKFAPRREILEKLIKENIATGLPNQQSVILIDEVQSYPEATVMLKILYDEYKVKVIATGSSELRQKSKDFNTLAGRFTESYCLPLSIFEIAENEKVLESERAIYEQSLAEKLQIFGSYPEVYTKDSLAEGERTNLLQNILDTYVLKDVIDIYELKNAKLAKDILTKIALQLGSEVSIREIADSLNANPSTVSNYIEIFIKNYILIPLPSFKTNIRKAVSENRKLYFYDLGIRNILVKDFRETKLRPDQGGLFENFIILEIEKQRRNTGALRNFYFYREYGGKEVDLIIEDYYKKYQCIEVKVQGQGGNKDIFPLPHKFTTIGQDNYFPTITDILK